MKVKLQACLVLISGSRICSMSDLIEDARRSSHLVFFQREAPGKPFLLSSSFRNNFYDKNSASSWTKEKISLREVGSIH